MRELEGVKAAETETDVKYLDPARLRVTRLPGGTYRAEITEERTVLDAKFVRAFPVTDREEYVELRDGAFGGVGMLRSLDGLDGESLKHIRASLEQRYFHPVIRKILRLKDVFEVQTWRVRTDRGEMEFSVTEATQNIQLFDPRRVLIKDTDNNTYEIPDWHELDQASRKLIMRVI